MKFVAILVVLLAAVGCTTVSDIAVCAFNVCN